MLNLSDNELDRLSREAASQHDPGDLMGPRSWDRLRVRLDKELGRAGPDVSRGLRGIRRLPFQYAPVLLLIIGVTYYFVKQTKSRRTDSSGSPPLTVVTSPQQQPAATPDSSSQNPDYSDKSTSTHYPDPTLTTAPAVSKIPAASTAPAPGRPDPSLRTSNGLPSSANGSHASAGSNHNTRDLTAAGIAKNSSTPGTTHDRSGKFNISDLTASNTGKSTTGTTRDLTGKSTTGTTHDRHGKDLAASNDNPNTRNTNRTPDASRTSDANHTTGQNIIASEPAGPSRSRIQNIHNQRNRSSINDSALRAYTPPATADAGKKSPGLKINRSLTFGLQIAPDFTSVNALAGDKPGSTMGLTVDYQVYNRWHLASGILFTRKNYTARGMDYHVPYSYYQSNGLKGVDFVKGTMNMIEVPLNIRYDFSVTGSTIFFASGGISAYFFGKENSNYYFDAFGREVCREFQYNNKNTNPLSVANLSLGVETGISNSISVQVAPYMKLPLSDIGFGKIRMNSVGINFSVRYTPVLSRKRQH